MKIGIYSPYLDTFGGGERYILTIAQILSGKSKVYLFLDKHLSSLNPGQMLENLSRRFNLNLSRVKLEKAPVGEGSNFLHRLLYLSGYDLIFYLTDGSIFFSSAKKSILHIQTPFSGQPSTSFWGRIKLLSWERILYNSQFTRQHAKQNWPIKDQVVYPPVDTSNIKPGNKKKYILSVGRFFGYLKEKKHEVMIQVFKKMYKSKEINGWSLHLVGSVTAGDYGYLEELKRDSEDFPVKFYPNLSYEDLVRLYGESSIYWHAAGYNEEDPTKMEHFGITTVEAMAGGCVPVVTNKGGQTEIVEENISGFLWTTPEELRRLTLTLITNSNLMQQFSKNAQERAEIFSKEKFEKTIKELVYGS